jgi:hypothetical protein
MALTLLTTEIYPGRERFLQRVDNPFPFILFAADRRISRAGRKDVNKKKVFRIPRLNAGIGYFGLAEVPTLTRHEAMADWLARFNRTVRAGETLDAFSARLAAALNAAVPIPIRQVAISGFHIAGFTASGQIEFWYVRNVDDDRQTIFPNGEYRPREDFQREHLRELPVNGYQIYRNGDIRAHVLAWEEFDRSLGTLREAPDFTPPVTPENYASWLKFKMETVARFYERFCTTSIIGRPVDAFAIKLPSARSRV